MRDCVTAQVFLWVKVCDVIEVKRRTTVKSSTQAGSSALIPGRSRLQSSAGGVPTQTTKTTNTGHDSISDDDDEEDKVDGQPDDHVASYIDDGVETASDGAWDEDKAVFKARQAGTLIAWDLWPVCNLVQVP